MNRLRHILLACAALFISTLSFGQSRIVKDFRPACDSLTKMVKARTGISSPQLRLNAVMKRGKTLDFYFTESLSDCPWYAGDPQWFRKELKALFPEEYSSYSLGQIYSKKQTPEKFVVPGLSFDGKPSDSPHRIADPAVKNIVSEIDGRSYSKGMEGRHIAVWQSHGRFYDNNSGKWSWQRPPLFQTIEDMFTQSFVLPYLVPMLENAGAYVLLPRERDIQRNEVVADNDEGCGARGYAEYKESGKWSDAGKGFCDLLEYYKDNENPFSMGTARKAECVTGDKAKNIAEITWTPDIPERGEYSVYVSYKTLENSTSAACYEVHHLGGTSRFVVNQKMGGGTWIYLGTFEFAEGEAGHVSLSNVTPEGYRHDSKAVVTADAVRFGGGMGNIARGGGDIEPSVSGLARSIEGARYWMQWAGVPSKVYCPTEGKNDYNDDYMSRGDWVTWISGGSRVNPKEKDGLGIPVDLSLGFHTDAGVTPDSTIIGTLAIYTLRSDGTDKLPSGESRYASREFTDLVQSQITTDLRDGYEQEWSRRWIWDRGYRESRTPSCPAMLLELLSHQNFADMKYGLDPNFRFTTARAIYKGMLKFLSNRYGCPYVVQPLPVSSIGVSFAGNEEVEITWTPAVDDLEPTAKAESFILYTRIDDGGFDNGVTISNFSRDGERYSTKVSIKPGHIYSYRIAACNEGGRSFQSETVSAGMPIDVNSEKKVLIVNNFDRVSGPAFIDTPTYAGFNNRLDSGVPDRRDIAFVGEMYEFRRDMEFITNDNPGFGASYTDQVGTIVAGNSFDYPYIHGKAVFEAGYPFYSCCNETFCSDSTYRKDAWAADIICGKQVTTVVGKGSRPQAYTVFPAGMQKALKDFTADGGNVLVSGAYIATDIWDEVYPVQFDESFREQSKRFAQNVLGYKWGANAGSRRCEVRPYPNKVFAPIKNGKYSICNEINEERYCVESPDGIVPASRNGSVIMRYTDTDISAGICHQGEGYRTTCFGFPLESLEDVEQMNELFKSTLEYFNR